MSAMVDSAFTAMPRVCRASRISFSAIPGLLVAIARSVSACGSRIGRRWPPIFAGAVLPVWRTRCISLIAADGLTANRSAAARAELPASTACAIRSRKSCDIGAVMPGLFQRQPPTPGIRTFDSVQARTAIVEDCLRSAILARGLERPRNEVESRFAQTDRLAQDLNYRQQRLRIAYNRAWTAFWWYEDYSLYNSLYDQVEQRAGNSDQAGDVKLLLNLWQLLGPTVATGRISNQ